MITTKELNKLKSELAIIGIGAKKELAEEMDISPSNITRYLKYGDIPADRLKSIKAFIRARL